MSGAGARMNGSEAVMPNVPRPGNVNFDHLRWAMITRLLSVLVLFTWGLLPAQNIDSLRTVWQNEYLPDSARFLACYNMVWDGYLFSDPDSGIIIAQRMHDSARTKGSVQFEALAYDLQAVAWYVKGDLRKALSIYAVSLPMHESINSAESVADVIGNMASMHSFLGEHHQALSLYDRALRMHTRLKDTMGMANDINAIGRVHMVRGDHARAIDHFTQSLRFQHAIQNDRAIATGLTNIGSVLILQGDYATALPRFAEALAIAERLHDKDQQADALAQIGTCHLELGDTTKAQDHFEQALRLSEEIGDQRSVVMVTNKIADLLLDRGERFQALELFHKAADIAAQNELPFGHATALIGVATTLLDLNRAKDALSTARKAETIANEAEDLSLERDAAELLYRTHRALGHTGEALAYHERFLLLRDSVMREENQREALRNQFAYDQEREALADSLAHQEEKHGLELAHAALIGRERARRTWSIAGLLIVAAVAAGIWMRMRTLKRANIAIQAAQAKVVTIEKQREAEAVRTRIARDIHDDMGGDITKIVLLSHEARRSLEHDPEAVSSTLVRIVDLSRDVSHALHDVVNTVDPRSDDMALVLAHARDMVSRLLEGTALKAELDLRHDGTSRTLDPERKRSLLLLLKEAVNNVLKHARATHITVSFTTNNDRFDLLVKDDGQGFNTDAHVVGNGLHNMRARAATLGAELRLMSGPGLGSTIHVQGPLDA